MANLNNTLTQETIDFSNTLNTSSILPTNDSNSLVNPTNISEIIVIPETDFESKEDPSLSNDLAVFNKTELCINRFSVLLSYMTNAEQTAFLYAFKAIKTNETSTDNNGRCFAPGFIKNIFNKIVKGNIKQINGILTSKSRQIRNSFTCIKKAFDKVKSKGNYNKSIVKIVNSQAESNKCLSKFVKVLYETLSSRRRYLLLNLNDLNNTAITQNNSFVGFPWLETEVNNITTSFLKYAECYQDFPNGMVNTFSEIQGLLSQDPGCSLTSESTRLLQKANEKNDSKSKNNTTNTKTNNNNESSQNTNENKNKNSTMIATTDNVKGNVKDESKENEKEKNNPKNDDKNKNNKTDSGTQSIKDNSKNSEKYQPNKNENIKKVGLSTLSVSNSDLEYLSKIRDNYLNLTDEYKNLSLDVSEILSNYTNLNSKCNYIFQSITFMDNDKSVKSILNSEINKLKINSRCDNPNYLITIRAEANSNSGQIICVDSDISCNNLQNIQVDKNPSKTILAFGCSAGSRFGLAYSKSDFIGNQVEFYSSQFKTCKSGAASNCAKNIKSLGKTKTLRFLEITNISNLNDTSTNITIISSDISTANNNTIQKTTINNDQCLSPIKKVCQDSLDNECLNSKLYQYIGELSPSSSGSPLPDACKNIDLLNPQYTNCFSWIADNLIKFTLFPNVTAILNIQQLISKSQENSLISNGTVSNETVISSQRLRNLELTSQIELIIVKEDASIKDKNAVLGSEVYTIPNDIMNIDGSTPLESADINNQASIVIDGNTVPLQGEITSSNLNSQGVFPKLYLSIILLMLLMFY